MHIHGLVFVTILISNACIAGASLTKESNVFINNPQNGDTTSTYLGNVSRANPDIQRFSETVVSAANRSVLTVSQLANEERGVPNQAVEIADQWRVQGLSVEDALKQLPQQLTGLLNHWNFPKWIKYAHDRDAAVIPILTKMYGDKKLANTLRLEGWKHPHLVLNLKYWQTVYWIQRKIHPDVVYVYLDLSREETNIFDALEWAPWIKYLRDYNDKYSNDRASLLSILSQYFSDKKLLIMSNNAKKAGDIRSFIQNEILNTWLREEKSPLEALQDLELMHTTNETPLLNFWVEYFKKVVKDSDYKSFVDNVLWRFNNKKVLDFLDTLKETEGAQQIGTRLKSLVLFVWDSRKYSAVKVFELLQLYTDSGPNYVSHFEFWFSYLKFKSESPEILDELVERFDDQYYFRVLQRARTHESIQADVDEILQRMVTNAFRSTESPAKVFKKIGLDVMEDSLLSNPFFQQWIEYAEAFKSNQRANKKSWFPTLLTAYKWEGVTKIIDKGLKEEGTRDIALMVWREKLLHHGIPPLTVIRSLGLDKFDGNLLASAQFDMWIGYLTAYNQEYPAMKTTVTVALRRVYSSKDLFSIFEAAKQDPKTNELTTNLTKQLKQEIKTENYLKRRSSTDWNDRTKRHKADD